MFVCVVHTCLWYAYTYMRVEVSKWLFSWIISTFSKQMYWGWIDGSVIKSPCCSCGEPVFNPQYLHGDSQPSVTPVSGDPVGPMGNKRTQCTYTSAGKTHFIIFH